MLSDKLQVHPTNEKMTPLQRCPLCEKIGIISPILPRRVCEDTALWKCTSLKCIYPMNMDHEFFKAQFVPVSSVDPSLFRRPLPADYQTCKSINGSETGSSDADSSGFEKLATIESDVIVIDKVPEQAEKPIESAPARRKRNLESSPALVASTLTTKSTPSFHRTAIMKHLVKPQVSGSSKRPLNDNGKGPAGSKFAKYSHPEIDAPDYANTKKLPQPGLLTRTSYGGGSSSSFFPGYVPSKDFSDRKSDVSSDASDRPRRTAALSTSIKRTLKNSIMNAMKPNPSPKNYDSIQTSVHTDFSQSSCSNFDLNDPFSSYEMISDQLDKNYQTPPISSNNSSVCLLEPGLISSSLIDNDDGFFSFSSNSLEPAIHQNECDMGLFNVYNGDYQSL